MPQFMNDPPAPIGFSGEAQPPPPMAAINYLSAANPFIEPLAGSPELYGPRRRRRYTYGEGYAPALQLQSGGDGGAGGWGRFQGGRSGIPNFGRGALGFQRAPGLGAPGLGPSIDPNDIIRDQRATIFGQGGDITQMLVAQAVRDAQARQGARLTGVDVLSGGDPLLRGYLNVAGDLQASGDVAQSISAAQIQQALAQQEFLRQIYLRLYGHQFKPPKGPSMRAGVEAGPVSFSKDF